MKKRIVLLLLLPVLLFAGCAGEKRPLLWYQEGFSQAVLEKDGVLWEIAPNPDGFSATILSPDTLSGVTWHFAGDTVFLSVGNVRLPVTEAMTETPRRLLSLFALCEEDLTKLTVLKNESLVEARFLGENGEILLKIGDGGLPLSFHTPFGDYTVREIRFPEAVPG